MVKIKNVETTLVDVHFNSSFEISRGKMELNQKRIFVKVKSEDDFYGYGEASHLPSFTGEKAESIQKIIENVLAPEIIGKNMENFRKILHYLESVVPGNHTAKTGLEMSLWDLQGKILGLPVWKLLGGKFRDKINFAYAVSLKDTDEMKYEAERAVNEGYRTIKTKLTGDVKKDEIILEKIREGIGQQINLRADVNAGYKGKDGLKAVKRFEKFDLEYLEQPSPPTNLKLLKEIRDSTTIPIAADESLLSVEDAFELIQNRAVDHLVIKLIKIGGIFSSLKVSNLADTKGISCTLVSPFETSLGTSAGLQVATTSPSATVAHELSNPKECLKEDYAEGLNFENESICLGDKPGLGVDLKKEKINFGVE